MSARRSRTGPRRRGLTLTELIVAIVLMAGGVLALAAFAAGGRQLQRLATTRSEAAALAETKFEELRTYGGTGSTHPLRAKVAIGGSTTASLAGYSDSAQGTAGRWYYRRWRLSAGIAGTRRAEVAVIPRTARKYQVKSIDFTTLVWLR